MTIETKIIFQKTFPENNVKKQENLTSLHHEKIVNYFFLVAFKSDDCDKKHFPIKNIKKINYEVLNKKWG